MTRSELKNLIKECLLEIVVEGAPKQVIESVKERNATPQVQRQTVSRPALDLIHPRGKPPTPKQVERPKPVASDYKNLVGDDMMASVFADTAASGLVERLGSPGENQATSANPIIDTGVDPILFEGSQNWAMMAFSESKNALRR